MRKHWKIARVDERKVAALAAELRLRPAACRVLLARRISSADEARSFLASSPYELHDPLLMKDMDKAVSRVKEAIRSRELILVYGDYDADGICATALLVENLEQLGGNLSYYVPDRLCEGYGLNVARVRWAHDRGVDLIICVDNGTSSYDEVALAGDLGIDVIVVDHHEPSRSGALPPATAVLNPKRHDCGYPFRELAGVGVALKLYQGLTGEISGLDLVAVGTLADVVPLLDENRSLVRAGLDEISARKRVGIEQLIAVSGLYRTDLNAYNVAFQLAPRINAAGRLGTAHTGVQLLLTNSSQSASEIARKLDYENATRRSIEEQILEQATAILSETFSAGQRAIVLADRRWHPGVIGVAASRIVERYYRPTALIALSDTVGKGSARSIEGFDLYAALESCHDLLESFGGHQLAAGFTIRKDRIEQFRDRLNRVATERIPEAMLVPELRVDAVVELDEIDHELVAQLERFRPFGAGNPRPVFACKGVEPVGTVETLKGSHIKFRVRQNQVWRSVIGFGMAEFAEVVRSAKRFDIAFAPQVNRWRDTEQIQLVLQDVRAE